PQPQRRRVRRDPGEVEGLRNPAHHLAPQREERGDSAAQAQRSDARLGLPGSFVEQQQRLARGRAVREGEVLLVDVVLAQGYGEQDAKKPRWRQPGEDLRTRKV